MSVCGTESSGSNPDRYLLFGVDRLSMSEKPFYFSSFSYPGTQWYIVLLLVTGPPFRSQGCKFDFPLFTYFFLFLVLRMRSGLHMRTGQRTLFLSHMSDLTEPFTRITSLMTIYVSFLYASDDFRLPTTSDDVIAFRSRPTITRTRSLPTTPEPRSKIFPPTIDRHIL